MPAAKKNVFLLQNILPTSPNTGMTATTLAPHLEWSKPVQIGGGQLSPSLLRWTRQITSILSTDRVAPNPGSIKFPLLDVPMGWRNPDDSSFSTLHSTIALTSGTWSWSRSAISAAPGSKPSFLRYFAVKELITSKLEKKLWKCKCATV